MFFVIVAVVIIVAIVAIIVIRKNKRKKALLVKAEQGDAQAQFDVYQMYKVEQVKSKEAIQFLEKSAENGHPEAQIELGRKLMDGYDIEKNPSKAIGWFKKAAEQGSADAQYKLGYCYMMGDGVEEDDVKAFNWFEKATVNGSSSARAFKSLADVQYKIALSYQAGKENNPVRAIVWLTKAAAQGHSEAQYKMALNHQTGEGVNKDLVIAISLLTKAAEQGHTDAQYKLGYCYMMGDGVEEDDVKAFNWFEKATASGSSSAKTFKNLADVQYKLAFAYQMGEGKEKDPIRTMVWLTKAAEQGHAEAQYKLGLCYLRGDGVEEDRNKAIDWCKKAAANGYKYAEAIIGFKEIEKAHEIIRTNYITIKDCCIELVKMGYDGHVSCFFYEDYGYPSYSYVDINLSNSSPDNKHKVTIGFGTRGPSHPSSVSQYSSYTKKHIENRHKKNDELTHIIHLNQYDILINSNIPWTEPPPECLKICAAIFVMRGFKISDPEWVREYPDMKQYINSAFRTLG